MRRIGALLFVAVVVAGSTWLVRGLPDDAPMKAPGEPGLLAPSADTRRLDLGREREIDRLINHFEGQVRQQPSTLDLTFLGELYLERARITGDVRAYSSADHVLTRALDIAPEDRDARTLLASVRLSNHDFLGALGIGEMLLVEEPGDPAALAIIGDASLELGRYGPAAESFEELGRRVPGSAAVMVRQAGLAFLTGDVAEAKRLAAAADETARVAGLEGDDLAWYRSYRAQLEFESGAYETALRLSRSAVRLAPDSHLAHAGVGRALAALGRIDDAMAAYERANGLLPDPAYVAALGDLHAIRGEVAAAEELYRMVEVLSTPEGVSPRLYGRELAAFYADHDRRIQQALELATSALRTRKDVEGWDVYAWSLYRAGRYDEASVAIGQALRLGTPDPHLHFHAGMIALASGDPGQARAELSTTLRLGPQFDPLLAAEAREVLSDLTSMGGLG